MNFKYGYRRLITELHHRWERLRLPWYQSDEEVEERQEIEQAVKEMHQGLEAENSSISQHIKWLQDKEKKLKEELQNLQEKRYSLEQRRFRNKVRCNHLRKRYVIVFVTGIDIDRVSRQKEKEPEEKENKTTHLSIVHS